MATKPSKVVPQTVQGHADAIGKFCVEPRPKGSAVFDQSNNFLSYYGGHAAGGGVRCYSTTPADEPQQSWPHDRAPSSKLLNSEAAAVLVDHIAALTAQPEFIGA